MNPVYASITLGVLSAALFGAATPASKFLLADLTPFQLAGLLYLGAALGVAPSAWTRGRLRFPARADRANQLRLLGAILAGGIAGPVLMLLALRSADAASVSLWLNFEVAATALLGVLIFREHLGARGWGGVAAAFAGAAVLSAPEGEARMAAALLVLLACVCWGFDNHLTALIDGITPAQSTFWKGLVAGFVNLLLGVWLDPLPADAPVLLAALVVGALAYGASITLYIRAAQALGATRAQIAFAAAPFFGVLFSVVGLGEPLTVTHVAAGVLFATGILMFALERHAHMHVHPEMEHEHAHRHDDGHHTHAHPGAPASATHTHRHRHEPMIHAHPHWPDLHHRHEHHH